MKGYKNYYTLTVEFQNGETQDFPVFANSADAALEWAREYCASENVAHVGRAWPLVIPEYEKEE